MQFENLSLKDPRRGFSPTSRDLLSVGGLEGSSTRLAPRMTVGRPIP
jgi:hypothetical protein